MDNINTEELKNFILKASRATYASGDESIKEKQLDGSTAIRYEDGQYKFHDNYFGGEPYGGREVVFLNNKPIWMMVYYGLVHSDIEVGEIYSYLIESLSNLVADMPYRGPVLFEKGNLKYENKLVGDANNFPGTEKIYRDDACVYEASYMGGFVDC